MPEGLALSRLYIAQPIDYPLTTDSGATLQLAGAGQAVESHTPSLGYSMAGQAADFSTRAARPSR